MSGSAASIALNLYHEVKQIEDGHRCRGVLLGYSQVDNAIHASIDGTVYEVPVSLLDELDGHVGHVVTLGRFEGRYLVGRAKRWEQ